MIWKPSDASTTTFFATANNPQEYLELIKLLYEPTEIHWSYGNDNYCYEEYFFDTNEWHKMFNANFDNSADYEHFVSVRNFEGDLALEPTKDSYPVVITFFGNHRNLTWISMSELIRQEV